MVARAKRCISCNTPTFVRKWCTPQGVACSHECLVTHKIRRELERDTDIEKLRVTVIDPMAHNVSYDMELMVHQTAIQHGKNKGTSTSEG